MNIFKHLGVPPFQYYRHNESIEDWEGKIVLNLQGHYPHLNGNQLADTANSICNALNMYAQKHLHLKENPEYEEAQFEVFMPGMMPHSGRPIPKHWLPQMNPYANYKIT